MVLILEDNLLRSFLQLSFIRLLSFQI